MRLSRAVVPCLLGIPLLSVVSLPATTEAAVQRKVLVHETDGVKFESVLVFDDTNTAKRPGLVLIPNWMGINEANLEQAATVAGKDYVVLVADVFGQGVRPKDAQEASATSSALKKDRPKLRRHVASALETLKASGAKAGPVDTSRLAVIGFCFGGTAAMEFAKSGAPIAAAVSFHGGLDAVVPTEKRPPASLLALHGAEDPSVARSDLQAFEDDLRKVKADWVVVEFGGAVHSFTDLKANNPGRSQYDAKTARRAYAMMRNFLSDAFEGVKP